MTDEATVGFETTRRSDIPMAGQRKTVRVNGRPEVMYVQRVNARAIKDYDATGRRLTYYTGSYTLTKHDGLWA